MAIDGKWDTHRVFERIDSFNLDTFRSDIESKLAKGSQYLALDLSQTRFLSLPAIQLLGKWAEELVEKDGRLALVSPSEKLKRQIGIFSSLDLISIFRAPPSDDSPIPELPELDASSGS